MLPACHFVAALCTYLARVHVHLILI
uniref:Uncharacterized protein n=1 Tax=Arundo donax TaxID=35708 RepID=A0A0A9C9A2_ARUDO